MKGSTLHIHKLIVESVLNINFDTKVQKYKNRLKKNIFNQKYDIFEKEYFISQ